MCPGVTLYSKVTHFGENRWCSPPTSPLKTHHCSNKLFLKDKNDRLPLKRTISWPHHSLPGLLLAARGSHTDYNNNKKPCTKFILERVMVSDRGDWKSYLPPRGVGISLQQLNIISCLKTEWCLPGWCRRAMVVPHCHHFRTWEHKWPCKVSVGIREMKITAGLMCTYKRGCL